MATDLRVSQVEVEVLRSEAADPIVRVSQVEVEVLRSEAANPTLRVSQVEVEILVSGVQPDVEIESELGLEASFQSPARIGQIIPEALVANDSDPEALVGQIIPEALVARPSLPTETYTPPALIGQVVVEALVTYSPEEDEWEPEDGKVSHPLHYVKHYHERPRAYAETPHNDASTYHMGLKPAWVVDGGWERISRRDCDMKSGQLEHVTTGVTLIDKNNYFRAMLEDPDYRFFANRPQVHMSIDDELRRIERAPRMVWNGFTGDHGPRPNSRFYLGTVDWIRRKIGRNGRQGAWQPPILPEDFDINTTPPAVLNRPCPWWYGHISDKAERTDADTDRTHGYLPDPTAAVPTATGSPANPVNKRFYFTGMNGLYGHTQLQKWDDHRGETFPITVVQAVPDDEEMRNQVNAGTASVYVDFAISLLDAVAIRAYVADEDGSNVRGLGYAMNLGGGSFGFSYGKNYTLGTPEVPASFESRPPTRNNTFMTLGGGTVTTDVGCGRIALIYVGLRLCPDDVYRPEFLVCGCAIKEVESLYIGGVRIPDAELAAKFLKPGTAEWTAVWGANDYVEFNGRRYMTCYSDWQTALNYGLISADSLSQGQVALTANIKGIETVGDCSGTLVENIFLQALHFAENAGPPDRPINAQGWVGSSPITFSATGFPVVDKTSFEALAVLYPINGAGGFGVQQEEVSFPEGMARFCVSADMGTPLNRKGQTFAKREPDTLPATVIHVNEVVHIVDRSFGLEIQQESNFANIHPYQFGQLYDGRTGGGRQMVNGLSLNLPETGGWASIALGVTDVRSSDSIEHNDQSITASMTSLYFQPDPDEALAIMNRRKRRLQNALRQVTFAQSLAGTRIEIGMAFKCTHIEGTGAAGYEGKVLMCTGHDLDRNTNTVYITAYDLELVIADVA